MPHQLVVPSTDQTGDYDHSYGVITTVSLSDQANGYVIAGAIQIVPTDAQPNSFTWTPQITQAAEYTVSAKWTTGPRHARDVPYTIHHVHGSSTIIANQQIDGGQFNVLGTYTLDANSRITLTDQADGHVIADAIKIEQTANPPGTSQAEIHYIHSDHLNTPQRITNTAQQTVWAADYQPFGQATLTTASITNPLRFPGQYYDEETNLHYNYFRDYDPTTGRYIQSDPIGLAGGMNTYGYVGGNPLGFVDPTGEVSLLGGAFILAGAVIIYSNTREPIKKFKDKRAELVELQNKPSPKHAGDLLNLIQQEQAAALQCGFTAIDIAFNIPGLSMTGPFPTSAVDVLSTAVTTAVVTGAQTIEK